MSDLDSDVGDDDIEYAGDCSVGVADGVSGAVALPAVLSGMCVDDSGGVGDGFYAVAGAFVVVDLLVVVVVVCGDLLPFLVVVVAVHEMMMMIGGAVACVDACVDVCVPVVALIVFWQLLVVVADIEVLIEALTGHLSYPAVVVAHKVPVQTGVAGLVSPPPPPPPPPPSPPAPLPLLPLPPP